MNARPAAMTVAAFFVAEEARADDDGLYVRGGFKTMVAFNSYPAEDVTVPLVVVMAYPPEDEPITAQLEVDVYDKNEQVVEHVYSPLRLDRRHPEHPLGLPAYMPMPVPLTLTIPEPGMYRIVLKGQWTGSGGLHVPRSFAAALRTRTLANVGKCRRSRVGRSGVFSPAHVYPRSFLGRSLG